MRRRLYVIALFAATVVRVNGQLPSKAVPSTIPTSTLPPSDPSPVTTLCAQATDTDQSEAQILRSRQSAAGLNNGATGEDTWRLVTDPSTSYLDRMFAAEQGGARLTVDQLPTLWKTAAAFQHLPNGVYPSPCEFAGGSAMYGRSPQDWPNRARVAFGTTVSNPETRVILDRTVELPLTAIDYPITLEQREQASWLWQMKRVLPILMARVRKYYAQPEHYRAMTDVALNWQPTDWYEAQVRNESLRTAPRNADWIEVIVRLALDDRNAFSADAASASLLDLYVCCTDTYHLEELVQTAQIVILRNTDQARVAGNAAYQAARLATTKYQSFSNVLKPMHTATGILAISRWALDPRIDASTRYSAFAGAICQMVDDPPYRLNRGFVGSSEAIRDHSAEIANSLSIFQTWFEGQRERLERDAAAERPHLNSLAGELHRTID